MKGGLWALRENKVVKLPCGAAAHGQLAGHRGRVREGDVPLPPKAEALGIQILLLVFSVEFYIG